MIGSSDISFQKALRKNELSMKNTFNFPKDGHSNYDDIYKFLAEGILPQKIIDKPDMKKNENSRRTIKQDAIGSFKNTCKYYEKWKKEQMKYFEQFDVHWKKRIFR